MLQIVVHLCSGEHRHIGIDDERQPRVCLAQRLRHRPGAWRAREDEAEIARTFGQRHQQLIGLRGDADLDGCDDCSAAELMDCLADGTCDAGNPDDGVLSGQTLREPGTHSYGTNLTPDEATGIGGWSDEALLLASGGAEA